jgi:hypothetical protein
MQISSVVFPTAVVKIEQWREENIGCICISGKTLATASCTVAVARAEDGPDSIRSVLELFWHKSNG